MFRQSRRARAWAYPSPTVEALFEAETTESLNPGDPPLTVRTSLFGPRLEAKEYWRGVVDALEPRAAALRKERARAARPR